LAPPSPRFTFIDALRGVAAISVVLYHVYLQDLLPAARAPFAEPFHTVLANGYIGVYIFFVLSGFVIAHSVRDATITAGFIGRFALRRSLRLDPPYWAAIAAAIILPMLGAPTEALLLGCTLVCVAVAHVLYLLVERPAQRLSRRVRLQRPSVPPPTDEAPTRDPHARSVDLALL
jgi:peptidoglycan/LPS O-acetylase OafA/YrhL